MSKPAKHQKHTPRMVGRNRCYMCKMEKLLKRPSVQVRRAIPADADL